MQEKWYQKKYVIVLFSLFIFPIGLILLWINKSISTKYKIIWSVVIVIWGNYIIQESKKEEARKAEMVENAPHDTSRYNQDVFNESKAINENSTISNQGPVIEEPVISTEELFGLFSEQFNNIKLEYQFEDDVAPKYKTYSDKLSTLMSDIDKYESDSSFYYSSKVQALLKKIENKNTEAQKNYYKFGEPDEDLIFIRAACKAALNDYINDPDFEILNDKYYIKQTKSGYDYKILIRGRNAFGSNIKKEILFKLKFNPVDQMYYVDSIKEL